MRAVLKWLTSRSSLSRLDVAGLMALITWLSNPGREASAAWGLFGYFVFVYLTTILEAELHPEDRR